MSENPIAGFHNKYRPTTLEKLIGHEKAVSMLKGFIARDELPSAILFRGEPGAGKTTMARAFASSVLGMPCNQSPNFTEVNFGSNKSIDDIRSLITVARLRPSNGATHRFILGDEAQQILSNNQAANAFLKPLEEPIRTTTFLLSSMDSEKFQGSKEGRAILSRCVQVQLNSHTAEDLRKQALRIRKGERMSYLDESAIELLCDTCDSSMRVLANTMEAIHSYVSGQREAPEVLSLDEIKQILVSIEGDSEDEVLCVKFILAVLSLKFVAAQKTLIDVKDGVGFIQKLGYMTWFLLNSLVVGRHPKIRGSRHSYGLLKAFEDLMAKEKVDRSTQIDRLGRFNARVNTLKLQSGAFAVSELQALSAFAYSFIEETRSK